MHIPTEKLSVVGRDKKSTTESLPKQIKPLGELIFDMVPLYEQVVKGLTFLSPNELKLLGELVF